MEKSFDFYSHSQLENCSDRMHLPEDRISSLQDDVLLVILSFLKLKEVVKTSLLSRRWLNLWVNTSVLDFHAPVSDAISVNDTERQNYVEWVDRVLQQHNGYYLKEFKIVCSLDERYREDINRWLVFALARKVQSLELNFLCSGRHAYDMSKIYVFPDGGGEGRFLQLDLKCLKSLSLKKVEVTGDAINFFLLNCPFLERLEVVGTVKLVNLVISDHTLVLKYLKIKRCHNLEVLIISNCNLVSLDISSVRDLTLTHLPMLVELSIAGTYMLKSCFYKASSCCSQLEALTLETIELKNIPNLSNHCQLTKLKRLVIQVGAQGDESLTELISIINDCPHLEEIVLKLIWFRPERSSRAICKLEGCHSSLRSKTLKVFEFRGYYGRVSDVELIMQVVENVVGLEKIIIDPHNVLVSGPRKSASENRRENEAKRNALQQFEGLRESIPPHVDLLIRD